MLLDNSPSILGSPASKAIDKANKIFQKTSFFDHAPDVIPFTTLVEYDQRSQVLYTGDVKGNIGVFHRTERVSNLIITNIPVDVQSNPTAQSVDVLGIGSLMPSEAETGELINIDQAGKQTVLIDSLKRPIHFIRTDFDGDGNEEYLISCFGSTQGKINSGKLTLFTLSNGEYLEKIVKQLPGATRAAIGDFNHDRRPDIIALFAQGQETIRMFLNKGNLEFEEVSLLEFIPVYGSNYFELADINQDTYPDIILTNGDNGDHSPIFKYYHGVRVFINNGENAFHEAFFFPINGASRVVVRDFDADDDLDMVILAMYPDLFRWPQETLVYFENRGDLDFEPTYLEKEPSARWMLMDTGDIDEDGDDDLIVGSNLMIKGLFPPAYEEKWRNSQIAYTVFTNNSSENRSSGFW